MWVIGQKIDGSRAIANTNAISAIIFDKEQNITFALVTGCGKYPLSIGDSTQEIAFFADEKVKSYLNLQEFDFERIARRREPDKFSNTDPETLT